MRGEKGRGEKGRRRGGEGDKGRRGEARGESIQQMSERDLYICFPWVVVSYSKSIKQKIIKIEETKKEVKKEKKKRVKAGRKRQRR